MMTTSQNENLAAENFASGLSDERQLPMFRPMSCSQPAHPGFWIGRSQSETGILFIIDAGRLNARHE